MVGDSDRDLMRAVARYLERVNGLHQQELRPTRTPLGDLVSDHLGADAAEIAVVQELIADHRLVDADIAPVVAQTEIREVIAGLCL